MFLSWASSHLISLVAKETNAPLPRGFQPHHESSVTELRHYRFFTGQLPAFARQMHRLLHEAINRFCTICPLSCRPVRPRSLVVELGGVSGRCKEKGDVGARSGRDPLGVLLDQFDLDQRFKGTIQALI